MRKGYPQRKKKMYLWLQPNIYNWIKYQHEITHKELIFRQTNKLYQTIFIFIGLTLYLWFFKPVHIYLSIYLSCSVHNLFVSIHAKLGLVWKKITAVDHTVRIEFNLLVSKFQCWFANILRYVFKLCLKVSHGWVCVCIKLSVYACAWKCMFVRVRTCEYIYIYIYICVCVCVCVCGLVWLGVMAYQSL